MSKSSFTDLDSVPFPILEHLAPESISQTHFVNPFVSSGENGQNYKIFEELPTLPDASQRKVMVEELLSNAEIFQFFVEHDPVATKYHLELLNGVYKDRSIGEVEKHRVMIVLYKYISKRTKQLFTFLETKIDEALTESGALSILHQSSQSLPQKVLMAFEVVKTLERRNLSRHDFLKIDDRMPLRRMVYLWALVAFFASPSEKKFALVSLKSVFQEWIEVT